MDYLKWYQHKYSHYYSFYTKNGCFGVFIIQIWVNLQHTDFIQIRLLTHTAFVAVESHLISNIYTTRSHSFTTYRLQL